MAYWLIKSNPSCFSIKDLEGAGTEMWDGVRNYRARRAFPKLCVTAYNPLTGE